MTKPNPLLKPLRDCLASRGTLAKRYGEPRFSFERGTTVRVFLTGKTRPDGSQVSFDGVIKECIPGAVIVSREMANRSCFGRRKRLAGCDRFAEEDIDRIEVLASVDSE